MLFLGTGAAELYPNPFCNCEFCTLLRERGDAVRKRSALLLYPDVMVDCGPEALAAAQMYGATLYDVDHLFITHSHEDHLCFSNIEVLTMTPQREDKPLHIYLSKGALQFVNDYMAALRPVFRDGSTGLERLIAKGMVVLHEVEPYTEIHIADFTVYAIASDHRGHGKEEYALNYFIKRHHCVTLYACDTGLYDEGNLAAIAGRKADVVVMEGTFGDVPTGGGSHLNAAHFCTQMARLKDAGVVDADTRVYMTHINQVQHLDHGQYQAYLDAHSPVKVIVACDGLEV